MLKAREQAQKREAIKFQSVPASAFKSTTPAFLLSSGERRQPIRSRICFRGRVHPPQSAPALPRHKREFIAHAQGGAAEHVGSRLDTLRFFFFFSGVGVGSGGGRKAVGWMDGTFWVGTVGQELAGTENAVKRGAAGEQ